jgi:hypothetical protein
MDEFTKTTNYESYTSEDVRGLQARPSARLKMTVNAAVAILTGGLAAAWYYRKALSRLQQAEKRDSNSNFGISEPHDGE